MAADEGKNDRICNSGAGHSGGGGYSLYQNRITVTEINGYLGGEKIGLIEDEEIKSLLKKKYHLEIDYSRAGSLDMVTADLTGRDYLFPSSQTALEYYQELYGKAPSDEIMFNTPIVLYSYQIVADAMEKEGIITKTDGVYYADMQKLTELMMEEKTWNDIGLSQLYGPIIVDTTDPTKSNSGNMYAALTANEMLVKNAELLKTNTVETAKESNRGIVDIETLQRINENLISTIEETIQIQKEGREKRVAAEAELGRIENELKNKLMEVSRKPT